MLPFYLLAFAFTRNLCLPQTLFLATIQNLTEKSHKAFCQSNQGDCFDLLSHPFVRQAVNNCPLQNIFLLG